MTFSEIRTEVRRRLDEVNANFWSDDDVNQAINDGYAELSDASEWNEASATITLYANQVYYNASTLTNTEFLSVRACQNPTTKWWLEPSDTLYLDAHVHTRWESIT